MQLDEVSKTALITTGIKIAVPVIAIGAGVLVIRKVFKKKTNPDGTSSKVAPSIKDTVIQRENLTISASDAALFANTLYPKQEVVH